MHIFILFQNFSQVLKKLNFILLALTACLNVFAQNKTEELTIQPEVFLLMQSDVFYLKNSGEVVSTKDSAGYIRVISPPDSSNLNLYIVRDFFTNGRPKLVGASL